MTVVEPISSSGAPEIGVLIRYKSGELVERALIDTGFSGFLLLSPADAEYFELPVVVEDELILADGKTVTVYLSSAEVELGNCVYEGNVGWIEKSVDTDIIIGCELLKDARVIIDYDAMEVRVPQV
jgi:clan AA aspartic protease